MVCKNFEKYLNNDVENPEYLFLGNDQKVDVINLNQSDSIFIFPELIRASAYSFKNSIKEDNLYNDYKIEIENSDKYPAMIVENANINKNYQGYIYVFENNENFIKDKHSRKYRCNQEIVVPLEIIQINYNDFKDNYKIIYKNPIHRDEQERMYYFPLYSKKKNNQTNNTANISSESNKSK